MMRKIPKTLLLGAMIVGLACVGRSAHGDWSLNPFASNKSQTRTYDTSTKKSPSAADKVAAGTKNFFNKTGEALGLKKPQPKKAPPFVAAKPRTAPPRYQEKKGMFGWLVPDKPRAKTVKEWIDHTSQITP
jgi:hypothetical protein